MKVRSKNPFFIGFVAAALLGACAEPDDDFVSNPAFAWCGDSICGWTSTGTGKVAKVSSWHTKDYVAALEGQDVVLTQYSQHNSLTGCLSFSIMGLVDRSAELTLELDYQDDGEVEHVEHIPQSEWQTFNYVATTPDWFEGVRISLRKQGEGRVLLGRIEIEGTDSCSGARAVATNKRAGVFCEASEECQRGSCAMPKRPEECQPCVADENCSAGQTCFSFLCPEGGACPSPEGVCTSSENFSYCYSFEAFRCSDCSKDSECEPEELCVQHERYGACEKAGSLRIGELCGRDKECASNVCNHGSCSECDADRLCASGESCIQSQESYSDHSLQHDPLVCNPGMKARERGESCLSPTDCKSNRCLDLELRCEGGQYYCNADLGSCECEILSVVEISAAGHCR